MLVKTVIYSVVGGFTFISENSFALRLFEEKNQVGVKVNLVVPYFFIVKLVSLVVVMV